MKKKLLPLLSIVLIGASTLAGGWLAGGSRVKGTLANTETVDYRSFGFEEALNFTKENYAGTLDIEQLTKFSIEGMLHQLDPHSSFFTRAEFEELQTETNSRIYGIGVTIVRRYDRVYILSTTPGAPGHRAGLRYGDAIIRIDGTDVENWTTEQVMHKVRGEKGQEVEITVERAGLTQPLTVRLRRDEVKLPTVRNVFMVGQEGIGYIGLTGGFSRKTSEEVSDAIEQLKRQGMEQLILDLRGNPGGLLDQAVEVSRKFLHPGQKVVEVRGRENRYTPVTYDVPDTNKPETMPLVVLISGNSASASEVVAGALQDHDRAWIVGENSFGKGLVQNVKPVWGGAGLTLTVAKYYTPTGRSIQRDYSGVSFYDYYYKRQNGDAKSGDAGRNDGVQTDGGRTVYGGGGITPDFTLKAEEKSPRLFYGIFSFVRQLVAGQIAGFREYRISETQYRQPYSAETINRYPISEPLLAAFRQYLTTKPPFQVTDEQFNANLNYIRTQMRREILTAAFGPEVGEQAYISEDNQLQEAIHSFDKARQLNETARRVYGEGEKQSEVRLKN